MPEAATFLSKSKVLGVDIGTTNIRCYVYDRWSNVIGKAAEKVPLLDFGDGRHEIDPGLLWAVFQKVVKNCLTCNHLTAEEISCIGIATQRGTFVTWDSALYRNTGETFHNFITWKDKRAEKHCASWNSSLSMKLFRFGAFLLYLVSRKRQFQVASALKVTSAMVLMRLCWILEHVLNVREKSLKGEAVFGTIDTWLVWKLTGGKVHATDGSNACVTGFFNPFKLQWAEWMLNMFNIPVNILPKIKDTCDSYGDTLPEIFGASIPINAVVGDQQAALFGSCCFEKYDINCTMGTGSFLNMNTGFTPPAAYQGVYPLVGWTIHSETTYIAECGVHETGTIVSWAQNIGFFDHPDKSSSIAQSVSDSGGVYFLPAACESEHSLNGKSGTSSFIGLKTHTSKEHVVRSILEGLAFKVFFLFDWIAHDLKGAKNRPAFRICGGVAKNDFIVQLIADMTARPIERLKNTDSSSLGAALLAGLYYGMWKNEDEIASLQREVETFLPNSFSNEKYYNFFLKWKKAVSYEL